MSNLNTTNTVAPSRAKKLTKRDTMEQREKARTKRLDKKVKKEEALRKQQKRNRKNDKLTKSGKEVNTRIAGGVKDTKRENYKFSVSRIYFFK